MRAERILKKQRRTAEEAAIDEAFKKEREQLDLDAFLPTYARATGFSFAVEEAPEDPDFILRRSDGLVFGVELTAVREQGPSDTPLFREVLTGSREWDRDDALDEMWRMIYQKSDKIRNYRTQYNILVLQNVEANYALLCNGAMQIPVTDFSSIGFQEIWLADFTELRCGRHQEVELLGLYPLERRCLIKRSDYDHKPYG